MLKHRKKTNKIILFMSFWIRCCYSTEFTNNLDDVEKGFGNNIQIFHHEPLQQKQSDKNTKYIWYTIDISHIIKSVKTPIINHDLKEKCKSFNCVGIFKSNILKKITQKVYYYFSSPVIIDYVCQVAASITSGIILYKIYNYH